MNTAIVNQPTTEPSAVAKRKRGRPPALDNVKKREVLALLAAGCDMVTAANFVSCAPSTIRRHADRDPEFCDALGRASSTAQISSLQAIRQAANTHWRAAGAPTIACAKINKPREPSSASIR